MTDMDTMQQETTQPEGSMETSEETTTTDPQAGVQDSQQGSEDDNFVRVPASNLESLGYGRDAYRMLGEHKKLKDRVSKYEQSQVDDILSEAERLGVSPSDLVAFLKGQGQPEQAAQPYGAGEVPAQGQQDQQLWQTVQQLQQQIQELSPDKITSQIESRMSQKQRQQQAWQESNQAFEAALDKLQVGGTKQKLQIEGRTKEVDPVRDYLASPALAMAVQEIMDIDLTSQGLSQDSREYQQAMQQPPSPKQIERAMAIAQPIIANSLAQRQMAEAQNQSHIPPASLGGQPGGRAQKSPSDMDAAEQLQKANRKFLAKHDS